MIAFTGTQFLGLILLGFLLCVLGASMVRALTQDAREWLERNRDLDDDPEWDDREVEW